MNTLVITVKSNLLSVKCEGTEDSPIAVNVDDKGDFETSDNYVEDSPQGPKDNTPDEDVPAFGEPQEIPVLPSSPPYTVTVKTPEGSDDTPMVIDVDTDGVKTIRVTVPGSDPEDVRMHFSLH